MDSSAKRTPSFPAHLLGFIAVSTLSAGVIWSVVEATRIALHMEFGVDEFTYVHGGWLLSQGRVPYQDYFFHHFPFLLQLIGSWFDFAGNDPGEIVSLRLVFLGSFLISMLLLLNLTQGRRRVGVTDLGLLVTPLMLFVVAPFTRSMLEIRPDGLGFALFCGALLCYSRASDRNRYPVIAGILLGMASWSSEKVLLYGAPFIVLCGIVPCIRRGSPARISMKMLVATFVTIVALMLPLVLRGGLDDWFELCFWWNLNHESAYPARPYGPQILSVMRDYPWFFLAASIGYCAAFRSLFFGNVSSCSAVEINVERAIWFTVPFAFLSFAIQQGPYIYSLIPFLGLSGVYAGRAICLLFECRRSGAIVPPSQSVMVAGGALGMALVLCGLGASSFPHLPIPRTNFAQLQLYDDLGRLLLPSDTVYDNSGAAVTYPSVHYYYFTDSLVRTAKRDVLVDEVPRAIVQSGATAFIEDFRFHELPSELKAFLESHFVKYSDRLWLWGSRIQKSSEYVAPKAGRYFVSPETLSQSCRIAVDGVVLNDLEVGLSAGTYSVSVTGCDQEVYLLWLPRDGKRYQPRPG